MTFLQKLLIATVTILGTVTAGFAQDDDIKPIDGTNFYIYEGDGYTNIYTTDVELVYSKGYNFGTGIFMFNINGDRFGVWLSKVVENGALEEDRSVKAFAMFDGDKNTTFSTEGSIGTDGWFALGNTGGKIWGFKQSTSIYIKIVVGNSVAVYKITIQGGDIVGSSLSNALNGTVSADPFGGSGTTTNDPFQG